MPRAQKLLTPAQRVAALRKIVTERQHDRVDGKQIDLFSASAVIAVYDKLNAENQAKFATMHAPAMVALAFKFIR